MYGHQTSLKVITSAQNAEPVLPGQDGASDLEKLCPISLIRDHTKTDDSPSVTDVQLTLYRLAAFEAAEIYTGMILAETRTVRQNIATHGHRAKYRRVTKVILDFPTMDGVVMFYGRDLIRPETLRVAPGSRSIQIPVWLEALDASSCCNPCGQGAENWGITAMYRTGTECDQVPAQIVLGVLKYIAWNIKNPGDTPSMIKTGTQNTSLDDTSNNVALMSGALELWRQYRKVAS